MTFESRLSDLRGWLVLLARLHLDARFEEGEASDIAQEALIDAVRYREQTELLESCELEYWLRRVLRNKVIDFYRKRRPQVTEADLHRIEADIGDSFLRLDQLVADGSPSPSEQVAGGESHLQLANALEQLSPLHREVVVLRDLAGWSLKRIAEYDGCSVGVVAGRLRRARNELYRILGSDDD